MPNNPTYRDSRFDFWIARVERYGLSLMLLSALLFWMKPHVDDVIKDHREFLKATEKTQALQAETLNSSTSVLHRIDTNSERSERMLRDIHGKLVPNQQPFVAAPQTNIQEDHTSN